MNPIYTSLLAGVACFVIGGFLSWLAKIPASRWIPVGVFAGVVVAVGSYLWKV